MKLVEQRNGKITRKWIKKNFPHGYVVITYNAHLDLSKAFYFRENEDEAYDFLYVLTDGNPYAVLYYDGKALTENT